MGSLPGTMSRQTAPAPYVDRYARVVGAAVSPQLVTSVLAQADQGYLYALADLLDECRERDGHLHCELQKREERLAGAEWELRPSEGTGDEGASIARWCADRLREIEARTDLGRSFTDALGDMQGAVYHGRAVLEQVWRREPRAVSMDPALPSGRAGGDWWLIDQIEWVAPRRLAYATDWRLHLWDSSGTFTSVDTTGPVNIGGPFGQFPGIPLDLFPAGKWIVHRPRIRGVYPTREGLGRLLVWWSVFKRFSIRDLLAFAEWAGRGLRIGSYATGKGPLGDNAASDEDKAVMESALDVLSSAIWASLPDTTKVEIKDAPHDQHVHERLNTICNNEQSKAILGGTLGADPGDRGARSLGEVQERNELVVARADARRAGATLRRDTLRPLVAMNFGDDVARRLTPMLAFHVDPKEDANDLATRGKAYLDAGGTLGADSFRRALALPAPEGDEPRMGGVEAAKVAQGTAATT